MITPRFSCSQTESSVIISIYCPSIRAADLEINVDDTLVTVHVNPYFLRLHFSKPLLEDDGSSAKYDPSSGYLTVTLTKENKNEVFDDLDLLAKLLAPLRTAESGPSPSIEVLSSGTYTEDEDELASKTEALSLERDDVIDAAENDWQLPQEVPAPLPPLKASRQAHYGFLDMHSGYLKHATHTENEVNELGDDAEVCNMEERRARRLKHEDEKWDEEHYMADYMDDEYIQELLAWKHPHISDSRPFEYNEKENMQMLRLPRREYLATANQTHDLYLALIPLLFAYAYDERTTLRDPTPESAWTICNLVPAFTALEPPRPSYYRGGPHVFSPDELKESLVPSYRRSLAFPLYRSFMLAEKCLQDVAHFLQKGQRTVMRCLLEMKDILDHHEVYYVYSKIWVDDFCVWIQADADDEILQQLGTALRNVEVDKASIGWDLEELEAAASRTEERENDSDDETTDDE
ncbi:unnamed protein product [Cyclocybe aegerita]|uniref:CS domain-containing protein n=1 Tax=Cyclocybe aegerita TaxID=1973307 RepID=A0A8S0WLL1_CYCAE|nr:unnamed protein product [Cyclocybe aegerita]